MEAIRGWLVGAATAEIPRLEGAHGGAVAGCQYQSPRVESAPGFSAWN